MLRLIFGALFFAASLLTPEQAGDDAAGRSGQPATDQAATQPASRPAPRDPEQARIFETLLRESDRPHARPVLSEATGPATRGGEAATGALLLDGTPLSQCAGRLVCSGDRSLFEFKSGAPAEGAPSAMEILRNAWLEAMEAELATGVSEFIISAEVTRYRGRNYLLVRNYRRQIEHGNLNP